MEITIGLLITAVGAVVAWVGFNEARRPALEDASEYLRSLDDDAPEIDGFQQILAEPFLNRVLRPIASGLVGFVTTALPRNYRDKVRHRLLLAGLAGRYRSEEVIAGQVLAAAFGLVAVLVWAVVGGASSRITILFLVLAPGIGVLIPPALLNRKIEERQDALRRDLPDTLDLLSISVEAGMGFEGAMGVVCDHFDSPLAEEFSRTLKEMELGLPRREALQNMKRRTEVAELSNFVLALTQADALGMPIGRVLKTQAAEMRLKRRQWAREGSEASGEDLVPARGVHFPADLRRRPRTGRHGDRTRVRALTTERDRLATFGPAIVAIRWGTVALGLALAVPFASDGDLGVALWGALIVGYTAYRSLRPLEYVDDVHSFLVVIAEVLLMVAAVVATGSWDSPFVFSLITAVTVAGFARGFGFALQIGATSILMVGIPHVLENRDTTPADIQLMAVILLVAVVAGYARRISGEADRQHSVALDRLGRLADANALLFSLHRVAQALPASLDLDEVLDSTLVRLRDLFEFDVVAVLLHDDTDGTWVVARMGGTRLPAKLRSEQLPAPLRRAIDELRLVHAPNLLLDDGPGLAPQMYSGVYAVLPARGSVIGVVALEHHQPQHFTRRDLDLLNGFSEPAALAVDNARWFSRLRTVGAEEERTRIARDLHDRIGQSLAYLAFELDRIIKNDGKGRPTGESLARLRDDVRGVVGEVRDTLYDLRTDVTDANDLASVLTTFLDRVRNRSKLVVTLRAEQTGRLPLLRERELFRIAQEAVVNVERHAKATTVAVTWWCDGSAARLEVADDGAGFAVAESGRLDSYGILGIRERAASIGASLDVESTPGAGARICCTVGDRKVRASPFRMRRTTGSTLPGS